MHVELFEGQEKYASICNMYWEMDDSGEFKYKVSEIAYKYGGNANTILNTVKQSCIAYSNATFCQCCSVPISFNTRSDYTSKKSIQRWTCPECIQDEKRILEDEKSEVLESVLAQKLESPITVDDLSFRQAIFLMSLVRFCGSEDLTYIHELTYNNTDYLSPEYDFDLKIVKELSRSNIIAINPISDLDAIELNDEGGFTFYLNKVKWIIPLPERISPSSFVHELEERISSMAYVESSYDEVVELCKEICLLECLSYLDILTRQSNK